MKRKNIFFVTLVTLGLLGAIFPVYAEELRYSNDQTKISFTVPEGYVQTDFTNPDNYFEIMYICEDDQSIILFNSVDAFDNATEEFKRSYDRVDYNNSFVSIADVAETFGFDNKTVSMKDYGSFEYFESQNTSTQEENGRTVTLYQTYDILINNGYIYTFGFEGISEDNRFNDYKEMLANIKINGYNSNKQNTQSSQQPPNNNSDSWVSLLIRVLAIGLIIFFIPKIVNKINKKSDN